MSTHNMFPWRNKKYQYILVDKNTLLGALEMQWKDILSPNGSHLRREVNIFR